MIRRCVVQAGRNHCFGSEAKQHVDHFEKEHDYVRAGKKNISKPVRAC
jgi:hypothetical protein